MDLTTGNRPATSAERHTVNPNRARNRTAAAITAAVTLAAVLLTACGEGDADTAETPTESQAGAAEPVAVPPGLQDQIDDLCAPSRYAAVPSATGTADGVAEMLAYLREAVDTAPPLESFEVPPALTTDWDVVLDAASSAGDALVAAEQEAEAGDVAGAERSIVRHVAHLRSVTGRLALMGAECGLADPLRAANADLSVPLDLHAEQLAAGFGSVWVSQKYGDTVVRVEPDSGEILATIPVGTDPLKLQPADGRMWVRTSDAFVAIDPATNTVSDTLRKADIGPSVNRNFAVDGAMWVCDGRRLHRYDPTTLEPVTAIDLGVQCDFVYATADLVIAWNLNQDPNESGQSATTVVDPGTNTVLATIDLPIDVVWPAVLDDTVFFGGNLNNQAVVIDRDTWTVSETIELPDTVGGGGIATDGTSIFLPTRGSEPWNVLVLDAETFEVADTIEPLDVNGIMVDDGALWVTHPWTNVLQRFDLQA